MGDGPLQVGDVGPHADGIGDDVKAAAEVGKHREEIPPDQPKDEQDRGDPVKNRLLVMEERDDPAIGNEEINRGCEDEDESSERMGQNKARNAKDAASKRLGGEFLVDQALNAEKE